MDLVQHLASYKICLVLRIKRRLHKIVDTTLNNKDIANNKSKYIEKYIKLS